MKKILQNDFTVLLLRLLPLYGCVLVTQVAFYLYNRMLLGALSWSEIPMLLAGSLKFATASIFFLNAPFIVLSMLPFRFRQKSGYQKALFWIYGIVNSIGLVVLNLSDVVYFRYAFKRITSEEMHFFRENDNTFDILFKAMGENWYLVLLGAALIFLLFFVYKKIKYHPTQLDNNWLYYGVGVLGLAVVVPMWVLGIRGSADKKAFPMSVGNAVYYTQSPQKGALILSNPFCLFRTIGMRQLDAPVYFGEGITIMGDKLYQLTWRSCIGFIYNKHTLNKLGDFSYSTEGWGLTNNGKELIMSDGTENIHFIDTTSLQVKRTIQVYDTEGPVTELNELEYVDGLIYANIYCTDNIVAIDPATGKVLKIIDMRNLLDVSKLTQRVDVLNGIAYQKTTGRWFVTGKLWPTMFQVEFVRK